MSVNIIGIFDPNSPLIMGSSISTTSTITILAAAATNGQANDAPLLTLRDYYDADAGAGTTSTAWDLALLHDMTAAGATPASSGIFKINSVAVLTLTNTNGTPSATFPGVVNLQPTLTGDVTMNGYALISNDYLNLKHSVADKATTLYGGTSDVGQGGTLIIWGRTSAGTGAIDLYTPNAAGSGDILRLAINGMAAQGSGGITSYEPITLFAQAATDGQANDAPLLTLRDYYDADAGAGVTSTAWDLTLLHDMTAGGAAPASSGIFKINSVAVLTLTNTNATPSIALAGDTTLSGAWNGATSLFTSINSGTGNAAAGFRVQGASGTLSAGMYYLASTYTPSGVLLANQLYISSASGAAGGICLNTEALAPLSLAVNSVARLTFSGAAYASATWASLSGHITAQSTTASPMAVLTTAASANLKNSDDTEKSTVATGYTKIKQVLLNEAMTGTVRITFDLKTAGGAATATGRIYKNGVALGTEQTDVTGGYVTKSEDLGPFVAGDLIQVYAKTSDGAQAAYVQNLRLSYDVAIVTTALSATNQDP